MEERSEIAQGRSRRGPGAEVAGNKPSARASEPLPMRAPLSLRLAHLVGAPLFVALVLLPHAVGQDATLEADAIVLPGPGGEDVEGDAGLELALFGSARARPGRPLLLSGTVYETRGLGTLRRIAGLEVVAEIRVPSAVLEDRYVALAGASVRARAAADGTFSLSLPVPLEIGAGPQLVVRVERSATDGRGFSFPLVVASDVGALIRADRVLYEPGETVHAWVRLSDPESHAPIADRAVVVTLDDASGRILERTVRTSESGVATLDVTLGADASQSHTLSVYREGDTTTTAATPSTRRRGRRRAAETMVVATGPIATTTFSVETRRTARVLGTFELERAWTFPGETISGTVVVTTPSGAPLPGAHLDVRQDDAIVATAETDASGNATVSVRAPAYLEGDLGYGRVEVRVEHPLGVLELADGYTITNAPFRIELTPEAGVLGVDVPSRVLVAVTDPTGEPAPAGLSIDVRGAGLPGGHAHTSTDAHGLAAFVANVPANAVATADGGSCAGEISTRYVVTIGTTPEVEASACVVASRRTELALEARSLVVAPGSSVELDLTRRPDLVGRDVVVELFDAGRSHALVRAPGSARRITVPIPAEAAGVYDVCARLLAPDDTRHPITDEGARISGEAACAGIVVRPSDAFALALTVDPALVRIRETTNVGLLASPVPGRAWAALVVRDEAQHEGELPFAYETLTSDLRDAVRGALAPGDELLVRHALAREAPGVVRGDPPVIVPPWIDPYSIEWGSGDSGAMRDPIADREALVRSAVGAWMSALVTLVRSAHTQPPEVMAAAIETRGTSRAFGPRALEIVAELDHGATAVPRALGGIALTPAMLTEIDPSFDFDTVARLVARWQLVHLLGQLHALTSTAEIDALRAIDGQPTTRWLAILVRLGWIQAGELRDPWGRPFTITCGAGRTPRVLFSARAADCAVGSPGPDGRAGTADDVDDPFARVVPEGTLFALASGEDVLMERLSRIAPGTTALVQMAAAYQELTLAAMDETVAAALYAYPSEAVIDDLSGLVYSGAGEAFGYGGLGLSGSGAGGGGTGSGYGSGSGGFHGRSASTPRVRVALSAAIREDLPATLFFLGEVALDASGRAVIPVPAADAMSSYHVEAVAWSASGWTTSARGRLRVDQDVEIDAPVPEVLHAGDVARLSIRLRSRALDPLDVVLGVETEGPVTMEAPTHVHLPAGEIVTLETSLRASEVGSGSVLLRATLEDGSPLDAIRRRVTVRADARTSMLEVRTVIAERGTLTFEVPAGATARGPAMVRAPSLSSHFVTASGTWAERWALRMRGASMAPIAPSLLEGFDDVAVAFAVGASWDDPNVDDGTIARALRAITAAATATPAPYVGSESYLDTLASSYRAAPTSACQLLLPFAAAVDGPPREALVDELDAVLGLLRAAAAAEGATATDDPQTWACVAAALALAGADEDATRVTEMLRRLEPHVIHVGDLAWLEPSASDLSLEPRALGTALYALTLESLGRSSEVLPLLLTLAGEARGISSWPGPAAALAWLAASNLGEPLESVVPEVMVDGALVPSLDGVLPSDVLFALGGAGTHSITYAAPGVSVLEVEARFGMGWDVVPRRPPRVEIEIDGEVGARDTRAALVLRVRNVGTRAVNAPTIRVLLPSGAELAWPDRQQIQRITGVAPELDEDELVVRSRPLLPGRTLEVPIRVRWSIAGALRGLGVALTDDSIRHDPDATFVVPSRVVDIADEGPEPELALDGEHGEDDVPLARELVVPPLAAHR